MCLLRTGVVLAREGGALSKMKLPFKLGVGGPIGSGKQYLPWIHVDDLVNAILWLIDNDQCRARSTWWRLTRCATSSSPPRWAR